jgi:succinyl-CoA synthetase beta subunit
VESFVVTVYQGVVDAYKKYGWRNQSAIIVRLQGTNAAIAKELIDSGMPILSAVEFQEAADQVKAALS